MKSSITNNQLNDDNCFTVHIPCKNPTLGSRSAVELPTFSNGWTGVPSPDPVPESEPLGVSFEVESEVLEGGVVGSVSGVGLPGSVGEGVGLGVGVGVGVGVGSGSGSSTAGRVLPMKVG